MQYAFKISQNRDEIKNIRHGTRFNEDKIILKTLPTHSDNYTNSFEYRAKTEWNRLTKTEHQIKDKKIFSDHILRNIDALYEKVVEENKN